MVPGELRRPQPRLLAALRLRVAQDLDLAFVERERLRVLGLLLVDLLEDRLFSAIGRMAGRWRWD